MQGVWCYKMQNNNKKNVVYILHPVKALAPDFPYCLLSAKGETLSTLQKYYMVYFCNSICDVL